MQDRAGDVVRQVRDDVVRRRDEVDEVLVERVALDEAERAGRAAVEPLAQERGQPRSSSTAVTVGAPAASSPPVRMPSPGRSRGPADPGRVGLGEDRLEDVESARKFWDRAWRARRPAARSVAPDRGGSIRGAAGRAGAVIGSPAAATAARRGRGPARSPAANRRAPAAPIIAPLSVHRAGRGTISGSPSASASPASRARSAAVRGHAAAEHDRAGADRRGRPDRLGRQDVDDGVLEAPGELGHDRLGERRLGRVGQAGIGPRLGDDPPGRGLEPREAEVVRVAEPRPREDAVAAGRRLGRATDRRAAGVAEAEQPPDLVERLAGGVVEGRAEQPVGQVVAHLGQERVAARDDERDEREDRVGPLRLARVAQPGRRRRGPRGG